MQAYTNIQVRTTILVVITLIANLFFADITSAQDTTNPTPNQSKVYCLPAVLEATDQAFPDFTSSSSARSHVTMDAAQTKYFDTFLGTTTPAWLNSMRTTKVLEGKAGTCNEVIQWLETKGFPMKLNGIKAAAGVFDLKLQWAIPGTAGDVRVDGQSFAAVKMQISSLAGVMSSPGHDKPIFKMNPVTEDGWEVFVTEFGGDIKFDEELLLNSVQILTDLKENTEVSKKFSLVTIPKINLEKTVDISFLKGMKSVGFSIDEAIKLARLKFSEKGMEASSAVVFRTRGISMSPPSYEIKSKFLVITRLQGSSLPAFVALCDKDCWVKGK